MRGIGPWLRASLPLLLFASGIAAQSAPTKEDAALSVAIAQGHRAIDAILKGDPAPLTTLFANRPDVTLGSPFGPYVRGKAEVTRALASAAAKYREGQVVDVERVATYNGGTLACVVEVEHDRAKVGSSDAVSDFHLRVTSVYAKLAGRWKLVHRHADAMAAAQPVESVLGNKPAP